METLPSVDDSPVDTQLHQHESHRTPSESKMNETSSTLVMIAQSKALFDRLEMEAKVGNKSAFSLRVINKIRRTGSKQESGEVVPAGKLGRQS